MRALSARERAEAQHPRTTERESNPNEPVFKDKRMYPAKSIFWLTILTAGALLLPSTAFSTDPPPCECDNSAERAKHPCDEKSEVSTPSDAFGTMLSGDAGDLTVGDVLDLAGGADLSGGTDLSGENRLISTFTPPDSAHSAYGPMPAPPSGPGFTGWGVPGAGSPVLPKELAQDDLGSPASGRSEGFGASQGVRSPGLVVEMPFVEHHIKPGDPVPPIAGLTPGSKGGPGGAGGSGNSDVQLPDHAERWRVEPPRPPAPPLSTSGAMLNAGVDLSATAPVIINSATSVARSHDSGNETEPKCDEKEIMGEGSRSGLETTSISFEGADLVLHGSRVSFSPAGGSTYRAKNHDTQAVFSSEGSGASQTYVLRQLDSTSVVGFYGDQAEAAAQHKVAYASTDYSESHSDPAQRVRFRYDYHPITASVHLREKVETVELVRGPGTASETILQTRRYTYNTSGTAAGRVSKIEIFDDSETTNPIRYVEYTYYGDLLDQGNLDSEISYLGRIGDLVQVKKVVKESNNSTLIEYVTQYRYYRDGSSDGGDHQIKTRYSDNAIARILAHGFTGVTTPEDVLLLDETTQQGGLTIEAFAEESYTYYTSNESTYSGTSTVWGSENLETKYGGAPFNETGMLKTFKQGSCSSCGGTDAGRAEYQYYYMSVTHNPPPGQNDLNKATRLIVADTVDVTDPLPANHVGKRRYIKSLNKDDRFLREAFIKDPTVSPPNVWCYSIELGTGTSSNFSYNRVVEERFASAHDVATDAELKTFLSDPLDTSTLHSTSGLFYTFKYNSKGWPTDVLIKAGTGGDEFYLSSADYGDGDGDTVGEDHTEKNVITARFAYPTPVTARGVGALKTDYEYTFWDTADRAVKTVKTILPAVSTTKNGSGQRTETLVYYDELGRLRWTKDGEGSVNYYSYHPEMGGSALVVTDVDTTTVASDLEITTDNSHQVGWSGSVPAGFERSTHLPAAVEAKTKYFYDFMGRLRESVDAGGRQHFVGYKKNTTMHFTHWDDDDNTPRRPIIVAKTDSAGRPVDSFTMATTTSIKLSGALPIDVTNLENQNDYLTWTHFNYDAVGGELESVDSYYDIPAGTTRSLGTAANYSRTMFFYDEIGRTEYVISSTRDEGLGVEQVTKYVYDARDNLTEVHTAVSDSSHNASANYATLALTKTTEYEYGGSISSPYEKDDRLTKVKSFSDATNYTGTQFHLTYLGHLRGVEPIHDGGGTEDDIGPYVMRDVSWMGRVTASAVYETEPTWQTNYDDVVENLNAVSGRRSLATFERDERGRIFRTRAYVVGSSGGAGNYSESLRYYNRNDFLVASESTNGAAAEVAYDGARRLYQSRLVTALQTTKYDGNGAFQYVDPEPNVNPDPSTWTAGTVKNALTISHVVHAGDGTVTSVHSLDAYDGESGIDVTADNFVFETTYFWHYPTDQSTTDQTAELLSTIAYFGSGDSGDDWTHAPLPARPSSEPTASDASMLVSRYEYDAAARISKVIDVAGKESTFQYDDFGRTTQVTADAGAGGIGRISQIAYDDLSVTSRTAVTSGTDQVTSYTYAHSVYALLATKITYADNLPAGANEVLFEYADDGALTRRTDQNGTVLDYTYTNDRRLFKRVDVTTLGANVDNRIRSIERTYDGLVRLESITSYLVAGGSETPNNPVDSEVNYDYDDASALTTVWEEHFGGVDANTLAVGYAYDLSNSGSGGVFLNGRRLQQLRYPGDTAAEPKRAHLLYGTAGSITDKLHRLHEVARDNGAGSAGAVVTRYARTAGGQLASAAYPAANIALSYEIGSKYDGLDRFGRIKDHYWDGSSGTADADRFLYNHDDAGNRLYRDIALTGTANLDRDQEYAYDGLYRLTEFDRGKLTGGGPSITNATYKAEWTFDELGNWTEFKTSTDNGQSWTTQTRQHNDANEVDDDNDHSDPPSATAISNWKDPEFDANGSATKAPIPGSEALAEHEYVFDAFDRMVEVKQAGDVIAEYRYDGLGRRIRKFAKQSGTTNWDVWEYYYGAGWQVVQVRKDTVDRGSNPTTDPVLSTTLKEEYLYHPVYIDAIALRVRDTDSDGDIDELDDPEYYTQDSNMNVTALLDASGAVLERYDYDAYGKVTFLDASFQNPSGTSSHDNDILFAGRRLDLETQLYHFRLRQYHPTLGRFVSRDPIGVWGDPGNAGNAYAYVGGNPVNGLDPMGLRATFRHDVMVGGGGGPPEPDAFERIQNYASAAADRLEAWSPWVDKALDLAVFAGPNAGAIRLLHSEYHGLIDDLREIEAAAKEKAAWALGTASVLAALKKVPLTKIGAKLIDAVKDLRKKVCELRRARKKGYRAVSDAELKDIKEHGFRPHPEGKSMEDKWFADTKAGAEQHRKNFPDNKNIVEGEVPKDVYDRAHKDPDIDGFGGFSVPPADQPRIKPVVGN